MDWLSVVFWGIVMLSVLVVVHEAGHFLAARAFHVRVTEFMVGLPGPSIGFEHKGTRFGITAIPLGGYARVCGMEMGPEDPLLKDALAYVYTHGSVDAEHLALALDVDEDRAETLLIVLSGWGSVTTPKGKITADTYLAPARDGASKGEARVVDDPQALLDEERKGTYRALPCWKRLVVLFAGPLMNILLAFIIFIALFSGHGVYEVSNVIASTAQDSPAAEAGIQSGDRIVAVDDVSTPDWSTLESAISSHEPGDTSTFSVERDGSTFSCDVTYAKDDDGKTIIGIYVGYQLVHLSIGESFVESWDYLVLVAQAIAGLFNPQTAMTTLQGSSSIVGIAYEAKAAADMGVMAFLSLGAAVSVSLGLMNLLPIPPLDGGHVVIEIAQKITRRELSAKVSTILSIIGIALFSLLFVYLLVQDIGNYVIGG